MTIETRQSYPIPRAGAECPTTRSKRSSRNRMRMVGTRQGSAVQPGDQSTNSSSGVIKAVMCETTNLSKLAESAAVGSDKEPTPSTSSSSASSPDEKDKIKNSSNKKAGIKGAKGAKRKVADLKKNAKKQKNGSSKEDIAVGCRKSRRLILKQKRQIIAKRAGLPSDSDDPFGRVVELLNPQKEMDHDDLLTKIMFLGSLNLFPVYCNANTTEDMTQSQHWAVPSLRKLSLQAVIKQKINQVASKERTYFDEKSGSSSTSPDEDDLSLSNGETEAENSDNYSSFEEHMLNLLNQESSQSEIDNNNNKVPTLKDCVQQIIRVGAKITFSNKSSIPEDVLELLDECSSSKNNDYDKSDHEEWFDWETHVKSLLEESCPENKSDLVTTMEITRGRGRSIPTVAIWSMIS